jgi:hypothetical protein
METIFPGVDPFLEDPAFWEDFHRRFITEVADSLLERLPAGYDARMDERVRLVEAPAEPRGTRIPDVSVDRTGAAPARTRSTGAIATIEPVSLPMLELDEQRDVWVEIIHLPERRLVTAIEVFSPTNKEGDGAVEYHSKRMSFYARRLNLVEIDLLRGSQRLAFARPLPKGDYFAFVTRHRRRRADVYAWGCPVLFRRYPFLCNLRTRTSGWIWRRCLSGHMREANTRAACGTTTPCNRRSMRRMPNG